MDDAPDRVRLLVAATVTALVLGGYGLLVLPLATGGDLAPLVIAARLIAQGRPDAIYTHDPGYLDIVDDALWAGTAQAVGYADARLYLYLYPPLWAALLAPLTSDVSFPTIQGVGGALGLAAIGLSVVITAAHWNRNFLRPLPLLLCLAGLVVSYPLFKTVLLGQVQPIVVLLVVVAIAASQTRRPRLAGAALATAAAIKLVPAVIAIYWLCNGRRDCARWFAVAGTLLAAASIALVGWEAHVAFLQALGRLSAGYAVGLDNQSLVAWLGEALQPSGRMRTILIQPVPAWIRWGVALFSVTCVAALVRAAPRDRAGDALAMFALFLVMTISAPFAWLHYFFCLAVPLMILARRAVPILIALAAAAMLSLPVVLLAIREELDRTYPLTWVGTIVCLAVLTLTATKIRREARGAEPDLRAGVVATPWRLQARAYRRNSSSNSSGSASRS